MENALPTTVELTAAVSSKGAAVSTVRCRGLQWILSTLRPECQPSGWAKVAPLSVMRHCRADGIAKIEGRYATASSSRISRLDVGE